MKIKSLLVAAAFSFGYSVQGVAEDQVFGGYPADVMPELSEPGALDVGVTTLKLKYDTPVINVKGEEESRSLTLEVWYPTAQHQNTSTYDNQTRSGKPFSLTANAARDADVLASDTSYPVVVLSHGYTGYRTIMYYLGEHLASHGYIVAGIDHTDSTNADVDFANAPFAGFPSTLMNRSRDQVFTLQAVLSHPMFKMYADQTNAGLIGYSMGGFGAVNTVGGCYSFNEKSAAQFTGATSPEAAVKVKGLLNTCAGGSQDGDSVDPRFKAMMALAPWGGQHKLFDKEALAEINTPVLYVAGDHDDISGYEGIKWLFEHTGHKDSQLLTIKNARHNIAPHPAPPEAFGSEFDIGHYLEPAWRSESLNAINAHFALALMHCYVKQKPELCEYLAVSGSSDQEAVNGVVPEVWTGFDHRYALGLDMQHK